MKNQQQRTAAAIRRSRPVLITAIGIAAVLSLFGATASAQNWESLGGSFLGNLGNIASVAWTPTSGRLDVFVRGTDNGAWHAYYDNGAWQPAPGAWVPLGGNIVSDIAAVSWGPGRLDIFARDINDKVVHRYFDSGSWGNWETVPGLTQVVGNPAAVAGFYGGATYERLDLFARRTDNSIAHLVSINGVWEPVEYLGGAAVGDISAISPGPGLLYIFARSTDDRIYQRCFAGTWGAWTLTNTTNPPLQTPGDPAVLSLGPGPLGLGEFDVFARDPNNAVLQTSFNGTWAAPPSWPSWGGATEGKISAVSSGSSQVDVFVRGTNNIVYHNWLNNGTPQGLASDEPDYLQRRFRRLVGQWPSGHLYARPKQCDRARIFDQRGLAIVQLPSPGAVRNFLYEFHDESRIRLIGPHLPVGWQGQVSSSCRPACAKSDCMRLRCCDRAQPAAATQGAIIDRS